MGSGDDLVSGQYNGFESTTILGGQLPTLSSAMFAGDFIVEVTPIGVNSDFISPRQQLGGILGVGCDNGSSQHAGAGVTGYGSPSQGIGVVGYGGNRGENFTFNNTQTEPGAGGIGVNGIGGKGLGNPPGGVPPGTGVLGQGGDPASPPNAGGAGVVGVAGGAGTTAPPFQDSAGSGVFGTGQRAGVSSLGNSPAGPGVVGHGGDPFSGPGGGGVVGVAGGVGIPIFQESLDRSSPRN